MLTHCSNGSEKSEVAASMLQATLTDKLTEYCEGIVMNSNDASFKLNLLVLGRFLTG